MTDRHGPPAIQAAPAPNLPAGTKELPHKHRVLVVDDNVDCAESMAAVLQLDGYETRTAHSGAAALDAAAAFRPHAVLLDLGLPDVAGHEVALRVRQAALGDQPVVVAMTGDGAAELAQRAAAAGIVHRLIKPVDLGALSSLLKALLAPTDR